MRVFVLLTLLVVRVHLARCQGFGGGGPSTFGYDASSACSKPYSRDARVLFENLPCDFRRQNWCTVAGNTYPWQAVRRFVKENQGLMRRMYGDERHINILKSELEKNDIDIEIEYNYQRYPEKSRRFDYDEWELNDPRYPSILDEEPERRGYTSRSLNDVKLKVDHKFFKLEERVKFQFKPLENPTSTSTSTTTSTSAPSSTPSDKITTTPAGTTTKSSGTSSTSSISNTSNNSNTLNTLNNLNTANTSTTSSTSSTSTTSTTTTTTTTTTTPPMTSTTSNFLNSSDSKYNSTSQSVENSTESHSTSAPITLADIANIQNFSINEIPGQNVEFNEEISDDELSTTKIPDLKSIDRIDEIVDNNNEDNDNDNDDDDDGDVSEEEEKLEEVIDQLAEESEKRHEFRPRPEYRPSETKNNGSSAMQGQLFQDVAAKEKQKQPIYKGPGINACPVKEEVVAPFWANNTRGEVLALLNLYPFEQYVHWEKCTHEDKQMNCRDGCKCEQQYRLHRLLAYDPNNECRGIFSDWFKFPSCCLCRCYNIPVEFRVTSRSPRMQKQKVKLRVSRN